MTDSSYQSFRKLKSVTLTLKTGLGGMRNKLVASLPIMLEVSDAVLTAFRYSPAWTLKALLSFAPMPT